MNKVSAVMLSLALVVNLLVAGTGGLSPVESPEELANVDTGEEFAESNITSVVVPPLQIGDMIRYDSRIYMVWYGENTSSGEFWKIELIGLGESTYRVKPPKTVADGFFQNHLAVNKDVLTGGQITLVYTNSTDKYTFSGTLDLHREDWWDLTARRPIYAVNFANLTIVGLGQVMTGKAAGPMDFDGHMRSWPNLNKEYMPSLEEQIYGGGKEIHIGDSGVVYQSGETASEWVMPYNWTVERGLVIHGYDTVKVNITSIWWNFMPYTKQIWISNNLSYPAKVYDHANYTYTDEENNFTSYMIIESNRTLKEDGFTRGKTPIPWGSCETEGENGNHFLSRNPYGEYKPWKDLLMPHSGGNYSSSSFDFSPEEAVNYAIENSEDLQAFLAEYPDSVVSWTYYNATKDPSDPNGIAGVHRWNLTFAHRPSDEEWAEVEEEANETGEWRYPFGYRITVTKNITREGIINPTYDEVMAIEWEDRPNKSYSDYNLYNLPDTALTLSSSEKIMKQDPEVIDVAYSDGKISWNTPHQEKYVYFSLTVGDKGLEGAMDMFTSITGITPVYSEYTWTLSKGRVATNGESFYCSVDATSGQMLGVVYMEGVPFMGLFEE
ncbi:MAG: hypothetical protein J7L61_03835 [Thermoplasmata archaeon]|nr:hypothetical protein [Thermoplasmata archaeon]